MAKPLHSLGNFIPLNSLNCGLLSYTSPCNKIQTFTSFSYLAIKNHGSPSQPFSSLISASSMQVFLNFDINFINIKNQTFKNDPLFFPYKSARQVEIDEVVLGKPVAVLEAAHSERSSRVVR